MNTAAQQDELVRNQFELEFAPVRHLLAYVSYSNQMSSYVPKGSEEESRIAASLVNIAWTSWLYQQAKVNAKDKLLIQQGQRYNEQSQKVKDLEYQLGLDFKLVNPDAVLILAKVDFRKFYSHEQMRNELDHLSKAFKKAGKQVIVFDSGYSLEVMTDEQLNDIGLKRTSVEHLKVVPKVKHFVEHLEINKNAP
ncbi:MULTISPECIES: hypothetical protein [Acinetobacter calcoaceticus/baumannii complex]|uniref:hypothetical protein n=1 Tax=Acinetobacter calcoaceticus/baumannii complex TaxID=909768 RepID=UPI0005FBB7EB|nr:MULTISPECIES: hypothetical protein [Acinetobacter calcoaceticus/baumannii complex]